MYIIYIPPPPLPLGYGTQLADLTPEACAALAAQPQTLLVGGGDGGGGIPADLCAENAQNAMRTAATLDENNAQVAFALV